MNVAKCQGCQEFFDVTTDNDYKHEEVGLGGLRDQRPINLCPPCRRKAVEQATAPAAPEKEPDAEVPTAPAGTGDA